MKFSIPCLFLLAAVFQPTLCAVAAEASESDQPRHLRTGQAAKDQDNRDLLVFCPRGNDWGDGTEVAGISEGCCQSCTEPPNVCATHWPSNGLYRCGVDPSGGWQDGTVVAPVSGWRCTNGWSYWPSSSTYRCGKDVDGCWADGTDTSSDVRTGCCREASLVVEPGVHWRCGVVCYLSAFDNLGARCIQPEDRDPAIFCSGNLKENCQT